MPSHWKPSKLAIPVGARSPAADRLNTLTETNISRSVVGGIDAANREYMSEAEDPDVVAPFLRENMQQDYRQRGLTDRTYLVLQGGDTLYHTETDNAHREELPIPDDHRHITEQRPKDSRNSSRVRNHRASFPERSNVFGHNPKGQNRGGLA